MTNIQIVGKENIQIPDGYFDIPEDFPVKAGDRICMVSMKNSQSKKDFIVTWINPDPSEIGRLKRFAGEIVIRVNDMVHG